LNGDLTCGELAVILSVNKPTVRRKIKMLTKKGLIRRSGPDKTGRWEIVSGAEEKGKEGKEG
jgi:predicted HTH transcriptional regulator